MKKLICLTGLASAVLILTCGNVFAAWGWGMDYGMSPGNHMMGGAGFMGWTMIIFWILVLVILVSLIRWILGLTDNRRIQRTPLDILKERLARGEIGTDEFEKKRQML